MSIDKRILYLLLGFAALYLPSYLHLSKTVWTENDEMHGPLVLGVAVWAIWTSRRLLAESFTKGSNISWLFFAFGLLCYFLGRSLEILVLEIGSQVVMATACLLLLGGWPAVRMAIFPLVFLLFMIPLPGNLVDSLTGSLKQVVSQVAEELLYFAGYPVARSGVVLSIGPYQLLVADACSGLKSMFSLSAMGFLYIYLMRYKSWARNGVLIASLLPIAFAANVVRVMVLILVTYHFGDAAGQGFVHDAAGIVLFVASILMLALFDSVVGARFGRAKT
jgi:exosortase B